MKTAISVPDELFHRAEDAARRLHVSRSELYATAVAQFLEAQTASAVTERLNEVYSDEAQHLDDALSRAQLKTLNRTSW